MINKLVTLASLPVGLLSTPDGSEARADWQDRLAARLRVFARFAYSHTPFYRRWWDEASVHPGEIRTLEDFAGLPVIPRMAWRSAADQDIVTGGPLWWRTTGGTTNGTGMRIPYTLRDELELRGGMLRGVMDRPGWWREELLRFEPPDLQYPSGHAYLRRLRAVASQASIDERLAALITQRGGAITSYPMPLWRTVVAAYRQGISLPLKSRIQVGGEVMTGSVRRTIARLLGGPVRQGYAASDLGAMAAECPEGRLHIRPARTYLEIMGDADPVGPGEWGEVVITNFLSHGRPLVRVRTGDRAMWGEGACPCGSPLPHLVAVAGRAEDQITTPAGHMMTWPDVEGALAPFDDQVFAHQAEQIDPQHVLVRLSLQTEPPSLSVYEDTLGALFDGMQVSVMLTDDIRQAANGKTRAMIGLAQPPSPASVRR